MNTEIQIRGYREDPTGTDLIIHIPDRQLGDMLRHKRIKGAEPRLSGTFCPRIQVQSHPPLLCLTEHPQVFLHHPAGRQGFFLLLRFPVHVHPEGTQPHLPERFRYVRKAQPALHEILFPAPARGGCQYPALLREHPFHPPAYGAGFRIPCYLPGHTLLR